MIVLPLPLFFFLSGLSFYCALFATNSVSHQPVLKNRHGFAERTETLSEKEMERERERWVSLCERERERGMVVSDFKDACAWESVGLIKPPDPVQ